MSNLYADIARRTGGDIYIGVVGPVRTGKSTLIKRIMEELVIPNIEDLYQRERARDELPQSGSGRTIMTAEPKFVPEEAVEITPDGTARLSVRLIDSVGYLVDGAIGATENGQPRILPIYQSTTYKYDSAEHLGKLFDLSVPGHMYTRISNPTVEMVEEKIAALEGGVGALCTTSGQAASLLAVLNICTAGDHFVAASTIYGGTVNLFAVTLKKFGIDRLLVETPSYMHYLVSQKMMDELFFNYSCIYVGGQALTIGKFGKEFTSQDHPHTRMLSIHTHSDHFFYLRHKLLYD